MENVMFVGSADENKWKNICAVISSSVRPPLQSSGQSS
jgi:hypothetical protein